MRSLKSDWLLCVDVYALLILLYALLDVQLSVHYFAFTIEMEVVVTRVNRDSNAGDGRSV